MNRYFSNLQPDRNPNFKNVLSLLSFCLLLFAVSMTTEAREYRIRASDKEIYTITLGEGNDVRSFSAQDSAGEMLRGATEAERKIATELYSAAMLFRNVIAPYNPEESEYKDYQQYITRKTFVAMKDLAGTHVSTIFAGLGIQLLVGKVTGGVSIVIQLGSGLANVLSILNSTAVAKRELKLLYDAAIIAIVAAHEAEKHENILGNFYLSYEAQRAVVPIAEVDDAWENFYKMNRYGGISHELVDKYLQLPNLKERLGKFLRSIAPISSSAEVIKSALYTQKHLNLLVDLRENIVQGVNDEASEYTANKKKDFRTALDDAGFFQPRRAKRLRDVQLQLQLDGSPLRLNVREYFLPNGDNLTYTPRSDNPRIAGARAVRAGSPVIIVTPKGLGSTSIAVELRNFRGLTATQRFDVTVTVKEAITQDPLQNQNLQTVGNVPAQTLQLGDSPRALYMSNYFRAPAGSTLTYQAWPNPTGIVKLERASSQITITPIEEGRATVIVRATAPTGLQAVQRVSVTVLGYPLDVSIPDANLAAAIREEIGSSITTHTLLKLTQLDAFVRGIRDLSGLEHAHNLEVLHLDQNNISDISPLANLTKLTVLLLDQNNISDISPLANLTKLQRLGLDQNNISDISPLANLTKLEYLYLRDTAISDISPLANLTKLGYLDLRDTAISDISPLANLTKLQRLSLYRSNISDISPLTNLTKLGCLILDHNNISDISPLANLTKLQILGLSGNNISDISPLLRLNLSGRYRLSDMELEIYGEMYWETGAGLVTGLFIGGNPLDKASVQTHIPALQARGVVVDFDKPAQAAPVLLPKETLLLTNYPNPFNPETWIPYQLAEPAEVSLRIYAPNGALVRALDLGHQPAGNYQSKGRAAYWDGRNELGERVANGLYFYTLTAGEFTATRKMLIRK